jgi:hypothetical protein
MPAIAAHQNGQQICGPLWHARFWRFADRGSFVLTDI